MRLQLPGLKWAGSLSLLAPRAGSGCWLVAESAAGLSPEVAACAGVWSLSPSAVGGAAWASSPSIRLPVHGEGPKTRSSHHNRSLEHEINDCLL